MSERTGPGAGRTDGTPGRGAKARVRARRDRRGHGMRGPLAWPPLPMMTSRSAQFDDLVLDAAEAVERRLGQPLELELAVEEVPPSDPAPWERGVPLGRLFPAERHHPPRLVIYRRPITQRTTDDADLAGAVYEVVAEQIARMLGRDPEDFG